MTRLANSFKNYAFANHLEFLVDAFRDGQIVIVPVVKVGNLAALGAMQMMMDCNIRVETLGPAECFDDIHDADICEGQKRTVDGIKGNVGVFSFHNLINNISGGMGV